MKKYMKAVTANPERLGHDSVWVLCLVKRGDKSSQHGGTISSKDLSCGTFPKIDKIR